MLIYVSAIVLALSIIVPFGVYYIGGKKQGKTMLLTNIISFFGVLIASTIAMFLSSPTAMATTEAVAVASDVSSLGMGYLAAALVTGLSTIGAGIAVASASSAALGAISEDSSVMGKALIFVALAEGIALYGLLISFMILGKL